MGVGTTHGWLRGAAQPPISVQRAVEVRSEGLGTRKRRKNKHNIKVADPDQPGKPRFTTLRRARQLVDLKRAAWIPDHPDAIILLPETVTDRLTWDEREYLREVELERALETFRGSNLLWLWRVGTSGSAAAAS